MKLYVTICHSYISRPSTQTSQELAGDVIGFVFVWFDWKNMLHVSMLFFSVGPVVFLEHSQS